MMSDPSQQTQVWAQLFARALTASHHRNWSDEMIIECALICADVAVHVVESYGVSANNTDNSTPPPHPGSQSETGFM